MDNRGRWSDVFGGFLLGVLLVFVVLSRLGVFEPKQEPFQMPSSPVMRLVTPTPTPEVDEDDAARLRLRHGIRETRASLLHSR